MKLFLRPVCRSDYKFLYKLLQQRVEKDCISHKEMPSYKEHLKFCENNPYKEWYVVFEDKRPIGKLYLTKLNEIGIQVLGCKNKEIIKYLLKEFLPQIQYANISPKNKEMQKIFKDFGFKLIQYTYRYEGLS